MTPLSLNHLLLRLISSFRILLKLEIKRKSRWFKLKGVTHAYLGPTMYLPEGLENTPFKLNKRKIRWFKLLSFKLNLVSFRTFRLRPLKFKWPYFRRPLFPQPVSWLGLFLSLLTARQDSSSQSLQYRAPIRKITSFFTCTNTRKILVLNKNL